MKMNKRKGSMIYDHLVVFIRHGPVEIRRFMLRHGPVEIWPAPVFFVLVICELKRPISGFAGKPSMILVSGGGWI